MDRVVDFFAGSGLVSLGLQEWFKTIWANDIDHNKGNIYNHNIRECPLTLGDISLIKPSLVPSAELYWASFPCQDLSLAGSYEVDPFNNGINTTYKFGSTPEARNNESRKRDIWSYS